MYSILVMTKIYISLSDYHLETDYLDISCSSENLVPLLPNHLKEVNNWPNVLKRC